MPYRRPTARCPVGRQFRRLQCLRTRRSTTCNLFEMSFKGTHSQKYLRCVKQRKYMNSTGLPRRCNRAQVKLTCQAFWTHDITRASRTNFRLLIRVRPTILRRCLFCELSPAIIVLSVRNLHRSGIRHLPQAQWLSEGAQIHVLCVTSQLHGTSRSLDSC